MPRLRPTIVGLAWCLAAAPLAAAESGRYQQQIAEYDELDTAGRHAWVERLLVGRAQPAAHTYLSGGQLDALRARHRAILSRVAVGGELSGAGLEQLLGEVDAIEQRAIEALRRDYAFATAQAFHDNRAQFERWDAAWHNIEQHWHAAGRPFSWQPRIIDWLDQYRELPPARRVIVERPAPPPRQSPPRDGDPAPRIQQFELVARITGYNLSLSRLISRLHEQQTWTAMELDRAAGELAKLATTRADLGLYRQLLSRDVQSRTPRLESLNGAISLLAARTAQRRKELESPSPSVAADYAAWELRRLDDVSRRLALLASARS